MARIWLHHVAPSAVEAEATRLGVCRRMESPGREYLPSHAFHVLHCTFAQALFSREAQTTLGEPLFPDHSRRGPLHKAPGHIQARYTKGCSAAFQFEARSCYYLFDAVREKSATILFLIKSWPRTKGFVRHQVAS